MPQRESPTRRHSASSIRERCGTGLLRRRRRRLRPVSSHRSSMVSPSTRAPRSIVCRSCGARTASAARCPSRRLPRSEEHTSELQSHHDLVCRLLLEKKKKKLIEKTQTKKKTKKKKKK